MVKVESLISSMESPFSRAVPARSRVLEEIWRRPSRSASRRVATTSPPPRSLGRAMATPTLTAPRMSMDLPSSPHEALTKGCWCMASAQARTMKSLTESLTPCSESWSLRLLRSSRSLSIETVSVTW